MLKHVHLYTDGACSGNPGPGGWGALLVYQNASKELSGFDPDTTNNRMELTAVIEGLKALQEPCCVNVFSDSAYVCNAFLQNWINAWERNGWITSTGKPVENRDLWEALLTLMRRHKVSFNKVKGHSGHRENTRCDKLAKTAISRFRNNCVRNTS